jgi:hypothetical protein
VLSGPSGSQAGTRKQAHGLCHLSSSCREFSLPKLLLDFKEFYRAAAVSIGACLTPRQPSHDKPLLFFCSNCGPSPGETLARTGKLFRLRRKADDHAGTTDQMQADRESLAVSAQPPFDVNTGGCFDRRNHWTEAESMYILSQSPPHICTFPLSSSTTTNSQKRARVRLFLGRFFLFSFSFRFCHLISIQTFVQLGKLQQRAGSF